MNEKTLKMVVIYTMGMVIYNVYTYSWRIVNNHCINSATSKSILYGFIAKNLDKKMLHKVEFVEFIFTCDVVFSVRIFSSFEGQKEQVAHAITTLHRILTYI